MAHLLRVVLYGKQCLQTDIVGFLLLQMYAFILIVWQRQEVSCLSVSLFELNFVRLWSFWIQARVAALDICTEIFKTGLLLIFGETGTQWSVELRLHSLQSYKVHSFILTSKVDVMWLKKQIFLCFWTFISLLSRNIYEESSQWLLLIRREDEESWCWKLTLSALCMQSPLNEWTSECRKCPLFL